MPACGRAVLAGAGPTAAGASDVQGRRNCTRLDEDGVGLGDGGWEPNMT